MTLATHARYWRTLLSRTGGASETPLPDADPARLAGGVPAHRADGRYVGLGGGDMKEIKEKNNVDYPEVTCVEWFLGYAGNHLGLKRAIPGLRSIAVCEREAFVIANMVSKMEAGLLDAVPIWTDCKDFPVEPFKDRVDLFIASYPCQGFSHAGKRLGTEDARHLWPDCRRFIQGARPAWVWLENVEGHVSLGLSTVLSDLEEDGYTAAWGIFSASEVGAPHQRKRVFILAHRKDDNGGAAISRILGQAEREPCSKGFKNVGFNELAHQQQQGLQGHAGDVHRPGGEPGRQAGPVAEGGLSVGEVGNARGEESRGVSDIGREGISEIGKTGQVWPARPGQAQYAWEPPRVVGDTELGGRRKGEPGRTGEETTMPSGGPQRETQPPLGRDFDGPADGLDLPGYTGLGDSKLAEIREWMVKGTNRTDELRLCGNGVVPATAEKAFRVLYAEIMGKA